MSRHLCVWRSRAVWAQAFERQPDPLLVHSASAFVPDTFEQPAGSWAEFEADLSRALGREHDPRASPFSETTLIATVLSDPFDGARLSAATAMQVKPPASRVGERDFKKYRRPEPAWIANRIACVAIAIELLRMKERRAALFPRVRQVLLTAGPPQVKDQLHPA